MPKTPPRTGVVTATTGTGAYALGAALAQDGDTLFTFTQAQAAGWISDGNTVYYTCKNASGGFEEGIGTYNHGAQTLTRTTILKSSSGGAAVTWGAGNKSLFCSFPSDQIMLAANNLSELSNKPLSRTTLGSTTVGDALFITASAAAARTTLGLGTSAVLNVGTAANNVVQLNGSAQLPAVSGALLTNLPSGPIPAGTVMSFYQAAAPSGWTRVTTVNDKVCMIVSAGSPGTVSAATWDITGLNADAVSLTISQMPAHDHTVAYGTAQRVSGGVATVDVIGAGASSATSGSAGGGATHTHGISSTGTWKPPAAYFLIASKN